MRIARGSLRFVIVHKKQKWNKEIMQEKEWLYVIGADEQARLQLRDVIVEIVHKSAISLDRIVKDYNQEDTLGDLPVFSAYQSPVCCIIPNNLPRPAYFTQKNDAYSDKQTGWLEPSYAMDHDAYIDNDWFLKLMMKRSVGDLLETKMHKTELAEKEDLASALTEDTAREGLKLTEGTQLQTRAKETDLKTIFATLLERYKNAVKSIRQQNPATVVAANSSNKAPRERAANRTMKTLGIRLKRMCARVIDCVRKPKVHE